MERVRDEQGVIVNWLVRIGLVVGILGIILFDAGSIAWNYFGVDSTADDIAFAVSEEMASGTQIFTQLEHEARRLARESGSKLVKFEITQENVVVKIKRVANTLVVSQIDQISDWGKASATGNAPTS